MIIMMIDAGDNDDDDDGECNGTKDGVLLLLSKITLLISKILQAVTGRTL